MTNKKKILIVFSIFFVALACIFGFTIANKQDLSVKADSNNVINNFKGSDILIPVSTFRSQNANDVSNYVYMSDFVLSSLRNSFDGYNESSSSEIFLYSWLRFTKNVSGIGVPNDFSSTVVLVNSDPDYSDFTYPVDTWVDLWLDNGQSNRYYYVSVYIDKYFNANVTQFRIVRNNYIGTRSVDNTELQYIDNNGKVCKIQFWYNNSNYHVIYGDKTYYLTNDFTDNEFYNTGYDTGYNQGYDSGYTQGSNYGYGIGEGVGYTNGFNDGVVSANDYSFLGLIGAVIDAPISYITSMFDFEILGTNLKDFFFAILTFALVILIVRWCLAK